jgi:hypothetical protein
VLLCINVNKSDVQYSSNANSKMNKIITITNVIVFKNSLAERFLISVFLTFKIEQFIIVSNCMYNLKSIKKRQESLLKNI